MAKLLFRVDDQGDRDDLFMVSDRDSIESITMQALEATNNAIEHTDLSYGIDCPVYLRKLVGKTRPLVYKDFHVGFVRVSASNDKTTSVEHLTLGKEVIIINRGLDGDWDVGDFYQGKYGLAKS